MIPIKKGTDLDGMRKSCRAVSEILDHLSSMVQPGMTTGELDQEAARLIKERGGKSPFFGYRGFPGHICASVNEEVRVSLITVISSNWMSVFCWMAGWAIRL
jgi:methionyl aminopeptidase